MKSSRLALASYGFALVVIVLDQLTKAWVLHGLNLDFLRQVEVIPSIFNLSYVENDGVSFGLFGGGAGRWVLSLFSVVVAGVLVWWAQKVDRRLLATAIGLVIGGAIGNVIDRIRFGFVVDFLDFSGLHFPWVFNIADSAICVGVALLVLDSFLSERKTAPAPVGAAPEKS